MRQKGEIVKGHEETFGCDGYVILIVVSGFTDVYVHQDLSKCSFKYLQFILFQSYLTKAVLFFLN